MLVTAVLVAPRSSDRLRNDAAAIWAEATARRDGKDDVASTQQARPLIDAVLDSSPDSTLVAVDSAGETVGFAAIGRYEDDVAEIRYLGVRPDGWNHGVASALMAALPALLRDAGFTEAVLSVYVDNPAALAVYRRCGWEPTGRPLPHPRSRRREQRYRLSLNSVGPDTATAAHHVPQAEISRTTSRPALVTRLVTFVDTDDQANADTMSVSARHEAVLFDGRRIVLLDDRGWGESGPPNIWAYIAIEGVKSTARIVVGPDAPPSGWSRSETEASHWSQLSAVLHRAGIVTDPEQLRRLPHDVVLSERLLARIPHRQDTVR